METRHVQAIGDRSFSITLPKDWIKRNHIKAKSPLHIEELPNGDIIIKKSSQTFSIPKKVTLSLDQVRSVKERLVFYYIQNVNEITVTSKKPFDFQIRKTIKSILNRLEGLKITDETSNTIIIKFLFKEVTVTLPQIIRRMIYLLKLMHDAMEQKELDTVASSETSIDRLYHLSERIIFNCLNNSTEMGLNDIQSEEELFHTKDIVRRLEVISDRIAFIATDNPQPKDLDYLLKMITLLEELILKNEDDHTIKQTLEAMEYSAKNRAVDVRLRRIHDLSIEIVHSIMNIRFSREFYKKE